MKLGSTILIGLLPLSAFYLLGCWNYQVPSRAPAGPFKQCYISHQDFVCRLTQKSYIDMITSHSLSDLCSPKYNSYPAVWSRCFVPRCHAVSDHMQSRLLPDQLWKYQYQSLIGTGLCRASVEKINFRVIRSNKVPLTLNFEILWLANFNPYTMLYRYYILLNLLIRITLCDIRCLIGAEILHMQLLLSISSAKYSAWRRFST